MVLDLIAEVATGDVEERSAVDVGGTGVTVFVAVGGTDVAVCVDVGGSDVAVLVAVAVGVAVGVAVASAARTSSGPMAAGDAKLSPSSSLRSTQLSTVPA